MLKEIEQNVDAELVDKAILYLKKLMTEDRKAAQGIANNMLMSYGAVANCKELVYTLAETEQFSDATFNELAHRFLDNISFGMLIGFAIATKKDEVEATEIPEESVEILEKHRAGIAEALMGASNAYVN